MDPRKPAVNIGTIDYLGRLLIHHATQVALLMNRAEALSVLHEILEALKESVVISGVSIDPSFTKVSKVPEGFMIKMLCDLDANSRDQVQPVLRNHLLSMEESKGCIVISTVTH